MKFLAELWRRWRRRSYQRTLADESHWLLSRSAQRALLHTEPALPYGGELWEQPELPMNTRWVVCGMPRTGDGRTMALSSDPRTPGQTICCQPDGEGGHRQTYTQQELAHYLHDNGYVCRGQLHTIILRKWHEALMEAPPGRELSVPPLKRRET